MRVHNSVYVRVSFQDGRMDVAFCVAADCAVHWRAVFDIILANVCESGYYRWACELISMLGFNWASRLAPSCRAMKNVVFVLGLRTLM